MESNISDQATCDTATEIAGQPRLWQETFDVLNNQKSELEGFLDKVFKIEDLIVILTGAGTSAYIGDVLYKIFQRNTGKTTEAVATTDLITNPEDHFRKDKTTLMVSFARSGDSPESEAAVHLADTHCPHTSSDPTRAGFQWLIPW